MAQGNEVAALIGNGLSIAYNPNLVLRQLTSDLMNRLSRDQGSDSADLMQALAKSKLPEGATSDEDFEILVGALDLEANSLNHLEQFAGLRVDTDPKLLPAITTVKKLLQRTRDTGVSHVLESVTEYSKANASNFSDVRELTRAICDGFDSVNFANLNYDTLLLAALVAEKDCGGRKFADLFNGLETTTVDLGTGKQIARSLRVEDDTYFDCEEVRLAHLHGSATYWHSNGNDCVKVHRETVEDPIIWKNLRMQQRRFRPCVVLTNSQLKRSAIQQQPFDMAYTKFAEAVRRSSHWLIIGYSFRDEPVNDVLRTELQKRRVDGDLPKVLVVTRSENPKPEIVERAFGWIETELHPSENQMTVTSDQWLRIDREGAFGLGHREVWNEFIDVDSQWNPVSR